MKKTILIITLLLLSLIQTQAHASFAVGMATGMMMGNAASSGYGTRGYDEDFELAVARCQTYDVPQAQRKCLDDLYNQRHAQEVALKAFPFDTKTHGEMFVAALGVALLVSILFVCLIR